MVGGQGELLPRAASDTMDLGVTQYRMYGGELTGDNGAMIVLDMVRTTPLPCVFPLHLWLIRHCLCLVVPLPSRLRTLPVPCTSTAFAAKNTVFALCVSTAFAAKTLPLVLSFH